MSGGDKRNAKELGAAAAKYKFPEGMRVLAIDNDPVCRRVLESLLRACKFNPTIVTNAKTTLQMLGEGGKERFDLVITDEHLPDMDGFMLVEIIAHQIDLPVIMLSVNGDKETILKGITHGACDCLVKPVDIKPLRHIWQHVIRKKLNVSNHKSSDSDGVDQRVQPFMVEGEQGGTKSINDGTNSDENKEWTGVAARLKQRLSWTSELHRRFLEVVNRLGVDNASPKKIWQMMDVDYLTRESVASHLQKYRLYLKRVTNDARKSNPIDNGFKIQNSSYYMNMNHQGNSNNYHKHQRGWPSSTVGFLGLKKPYVGTSGLGPQGASMRSMNLRMGTVNHGSGMLKDVVPWLPSTRRHHALDPHVRSFKNISDHTMLDVFPPTHSSKASTTTLREKLLEASNISPSSHPGNSYFADILKGGKLVKQFPVQPPEIGSQFTRLMKITPPTVGVCRDAKFPYTAESFSNPWHNNMASSNFLNHMDATPLAQSQVNVPQVNQLPSFGSLPDEMPMNHNEQQNQMAGFINNNTSEVAFSEQMTPLFKMETNACPIEMMSDNFTPVAQMVNGGSTSSPLHNLHMSSSVETPTQMVNGGSNNPAFVELGDSSTTPVQIFNPEDVSRIPHVQEGPTDQQAIDDHQDYNNPFFLEDLFTDILDQDFNEDGTFFGGEW